MRLLLDAHLSRSIARRLVADGFDVMSVHDWPGGALRDAADEVILAAAASHDNWTIVTVDQRTFPPLVRMWAEGGRDHAGVIFVDAKSIRQHDIGGLIRALHSLMEEEGDLDWTNRVRFLASVDAS